MVTKQTNEFKPLKFEEKVDGIPVIIDVKQTNGDVKTVDLFFATNDQSLIDLTEKAQQINEKTKEISKKYPALGKELAEIDDDDFEANRELIKGLAEAVKLNYDEMFGEGTYNRLADAGLGVKTLLPKLEVISGAIKDQLDSENEETKKQSAKRKAERLIKNKKKKGNK